MKLTRLSILLGVGHGLNDLIAGYFLGSLLTLDLGITQIATALLVYNFLAFGGQYPVALWMEKMRSPRQLLIVACIVNVAALPLFYSFPQFSIVLAGFASAVYHVAGGAVCASEKKAFHIGIFAAPGVAGLIAGGYLAHEHVALIPWLMPIAIAFLIMIWKMRISCSAPEQADGARPAWMPDQHDMVMIVLLTVISLRSSVWHIFQLVHEQNYGWLIPIAVAAFAGKIAGGWVADRIGWKLYTVVSLLLSAPLVSVFKNNLLLFCIGIGLLQSGIPATTSLMITSVKGKAGRGIALSFGAAIVIGGFFLYWPAQSLMLTAPGTMILMGVMFLLMAWYYFKVKEKGLTVT